MANALPLILAAGAAVVLLGGKKKRKKAASSHYENSIIPPPPANAAQTSGPSGKTASAEVWKRRQTALAFVAGMKVCNCHPGNVDGFYGPATLNAVIAFQMCAGIDVDGKWGTQTEAAMKKVLTEIANKTVKEVIQPPPKVPSLMQELSP